MPIVDAKLVSGSSGTWEVLGEHRYRCVWRVITEDLLDSVYLLLIDAAFPVRLGDVFYGWQFDDFSQTYVRLPIPQDENAACVSIEPQQDEDNPLVWLFTITYEGLSDPLATPADIDFGDTPYQEHTVEDCFGQIIANSALDPYEGGVPRDKNRSTLVISRPLAYDQWDPNKAEDYKNSLNLLDYTFGTLIVDGDPVKAAPGMAKLTSITASRRIRTKNPVPTDAKYYWQLRVVIDVDRSTFINDNGVTQHTCWRSVKADAGYQELRLGKKQRILTNNGNPSAPVLLDGNGKRLALPSADLPVLLANITPVAGAPIVNHGFYACYSGQTMNIPTPGVAANGEDIALVTLGSSPAAGSLTLNLDGSFTYTAPPSSPGWYYFTFTATKGMAVSNPATVLILVGPRPRIRIHEKYLRKDWSPLASWLGGW